MESRTKDGGSGGGMPHDYLFAADDLLQLKKKKEKERENITKLPS